MSIRAVVRTTPTGRHILECGIEEEFEVAADAFARLDELKPMLGVIPPTPTEDPGLVFVPEPDPEPAPIPISAGGEVTLHEPVEEVRESTPRKNAWTPEEDDIVGKAPTPKDAITQYIAAFPGKRTPAAIDARWRKLNPSTLQKLNGVAASKPELPERGATVRIIGPAGGATGKTGTVIRRDQRIGEVLINLGSQDGCVWVKPEDVEVVSE
jgi:hypothetical protein